MSIFRLTGTAGRIFVREGSSGEGDDKRHWKMRSQDIILGDLVSTRVDLQDDEPEYGKGEMVDLAVEVIVSKGYMRTTIKGDWPKGETVKTPARSLAGAGSHSTS